MVEWPCGVKPPDRSNIYRLFRPESDSCGNRVRCTPDEPHALARLTIRTVQVKTPASPGTGREKIEPGRASQQALGKYYGR